MQVFPVRLAQDRQPGKLIMLNQASRFRVLGCIRGIRFRVIGSEMISWGFSALGQYYIYLGYRGL